LVETPTQHVLLAGLSEVAKEHVGEDILRIKGDQPLGFRLALNDFANWVQLRFFAANI
jgi:hypothetical protein